MPKHLCHFILHLPTDGTRPLLWTSCKSFFISFPIPVCLPLLPFCSVQQPVIRSYAFWHNPKYKAFVPIASNRLALSSELVAGTGGGRKCKGTKQMQPCSDIPLANKLSPVFNFKFVPLDQKRESTNIILIKVWKIHSWERSHLQWSILRLHGSR